MRHFGIGIINHFPRCCVRDHVHFFLGAFKVPSHLGSRVGSPLRAWGSGLGFEKEGVIGGTSGLNVCRA